MEKHKNTLNGKTIWITGASRGIGLAIAKKLQFTNANVVMTARTSVEDAISKGYFDNQFLENPSLFYLQMDLEDKSSINSVHNRIKENLGGVDILINNAGIAVFKPFIEISDEDFTKMNKINYEAVFHTSKLVLDRMINNGYGIIINILSIAALNTFNQSSVYAATKAAVKSMSASLRNEVRKHGIKVINIYPGAVETEIWSDEALERFRERMMSPDDIAEVVKDTIYSSLNQRMMIEEIIIRPQLGDL